MARLTGRQKLNRVKKVLLAEEDFLNPEGYVKNMKKGFTLFITYKEQPIYISMSGEGTFENKILYRTAESYKDFGGSGSNNFLSFDRLEELPNKIKRIIPK